MGKLKNVLNVWKVLMRLVGTRPNHVKKTPMFLLHNKRCQEPIIWNARTLIGKILENGNLHGPQAAQRTQIQ